MTKVEMNFKVRRKIGNSGKSTRNLHENTFSCGFLTNFSNSGYVLTIPSPTLTIFVNLGSPDDGCGKAYRHSV